MMISDNNDMMIKSIHIKPIPLFDKTSSHQRPKTVSSSRPKSAAYMQRPYTPAGLLNCKSNSNSNKKLTFNRSLITSPNKAILLSSLASPIGPDIEYMTITRASPIRSTSPSRKPLTLTVDPHEIFISRSHKKMNKVGEIRLRTIEKEGLALSEIDKVKEALRKSKKLKDSPETKLHHSIISHHSKAFRNNVVWGKDLFVHDPYEPKRHEIYKGRAIWQGYCSDPMNPVLGYCQR